MLALKVDRFVPEMRYPPVAISDTSKKINGIGSVGNPEPDDDIQEHEMPGKFIRKFAVCHAFRIPWGACFGFRD